MKRKIIGAKVQLLVTIRTRGGAIFEKGSIATIEGSYLGYTLKDDKGRIVSRVDKSDIKFLEQ